MEIMQGDTPAPFLFVVVLDYALRAAISGKEEELGFTLQPRRSRRHPAKVLMDLDYADDIALLSENISQAQDLLVCVERECSKIGLEVNEVKTKVMTCNAATLPPLHMQSGASLESVVDFKYLGSWVNSSYQDIKTRKALAWKALNGMKSIWKSHISRELKSHSGVNTAVWLRVMGTECVNGEVAGRLLHSDAPSDNEHRLAGPCFQSRSLWGTPENLRQSGLEEARSGRPLS